MKTTTLLLLGVAAWGSGAVLAAQDATITHRTVDGKTHAVKTLGKFYVTPMGHQCAYDETKDPSLYPCKEQGVCVRFNATYGECVTQEKAAQLQAEAEDSDDSEESEESEEGEESESGSASASGSADVDVGDEEAGEDEDGEEEDDGDAEKDDEEEDEPPVRKHW